jgi:23S rRNA (uracil1939-C5)-methyltransferase
LRAGFFLFVGRFPALLHHPLWRAAPELVVAGENHLRGEGVSDDNRGLEIPLIVERLAFGGAGMGRLSDGKVCFVPYVIPAEKVTVHVRTRHASYVEADLKKVVERSPDRVEPRCPVFGRCGGCQYQHVTYARQRAIKTEQVAEVLRRLGGIPNVIVEPIVPSPAEFHYRNRITVHAKSGRIGFFAPRSRRIVEVAQCPIASDRVNALLAKLRDSRPRDGEHTLRESAAYRGFRQVNDAVAGHLLEIVEQMAQPGGRLLVDAYCGSGFFAKRLADLFDLTIGIEWSAEAIRAARVRAGERENYLLGDVKHYLAEALSAAPPKVTTLLLDPPADGLEKEIPETIESIQPARVIYVSCDPATLARDIKRMRGNYILRRVCPVDMFPQTAEIEVVALLEKS